MSESPEIRYVSRAGHKLQAALDTFGIEPAGWVCADLGCNVGGFVDCLLQRGAQKVYAVDTGYGTLAYKLRKDPRVEVMERTNAMHVTLPEPVRLITIDVGWTRQHNILPHALTLLAPRGQIVSLIKPHYEADKSLLNGGVLPPEQVDVVIETVRTRINQAGGQIISLIPSPLLGQKGNNELLAHIAPTN